jgi:hypothetical protein
MSWVVAVFVIVFYIHLFNVVAKMYFESDRRLTLGDIWRRFVPPIKFSIEV